MPRLTWVELNRLGRTDNARRWWPCPEIASYFERIRPPSRAWPYSYARAAMTLRFARWLEVNHPNILN